MPASLDWVRMFGDCVCLLLVGTFLVPYPCHLLTHVEVVSVYTILMTSRQGFGEPEGFAYVCTASEWHGPD